MEIKESMELLEGLKLLGVSVKKVAADGKLGVEDLSELLALGKNLNALIAAGQGVDQIGAELKELSSEELQQLGSKVLEVVAAIKAA